MVSLDVEATWKQIEVEADILLQFYRMVLVEGAGLIPVLSDLTGRRISVAHRNADALLEPHLQLCGTVHVFSLCSVALSSGCATPFKMA